MPKQDVSESTLIRVYFTLYLNHGIENTNHENALWISLLCVLQCAWVKILVYQNYRFNRIADSRNMNLYC